MITTGAASLEDRVTVDGMILQTNRRVILDGLRTIDLNHTCGEVTAYISSQRWRIHLDTGRIVEVKATNLMRTCMSPNYADMIN